MGSEEHVIATSQTTDAAVWARTRQNLTLSEHALQGSPGQEEQVW
jgi:hypothetical protein